MNQAPINPADVGEAIARLGSHITQPAHRGYHRVDSYPLWALKWFGDAGLLNVHTDDGTYDQGASLIRETLLQISTAVQTPTLAADTDEIYLIHDGAEFDGLIGGSTVSGYFCDLERSDTGLWVDTVNLSFVSDAAAVTWMAPIIQAPFRFDVVNIDTVKVAGRSITTTYLWWD